jgi:hypothetical protein
MEKVTIFRLSQVSSVLCFVSQSVHASHSSIDPLGWWLMGLFSLVVIFGFLYQQQKLNDPTDGTLVSIDKIG